MILFDFLLHLILFYYFNKSFDIWRWFGGGERRGGRRSSPVDDAVVIVRPDFETVAVAGRNVAEQVDFFSFQLGALQLVDEPLELLRRIRAV